MEDESASGQPELAHATRNKQARTPTIRAFITPPFATSVGRYDLTLLRVSRVANASRQFPGFYTWQALAKRPTALYRPSRRSMPSKLPPLEFAANLEIRRVDHKGQLKFPTKRVLFSHTFAHEPVGFEEIDDGIWSVW